MSSPLIAFTLDRPANAIVWQAQMAALQRRKRWLWQSSRAGLVAGATLLLVSAFVLHGAWARTIELITTALVLYVLLVDRWRRLASEDLAALQPFQPEPAQLTRWQASPAAVAYRQAVLGQSDVPILKGDAERMDRLFQAHHATQRATA